MAHRPACRRSCLSRFAAARSWTASGFRQPSPPRGRAARRDRPRRRQLPRPGLAPRSPCPSRCRAGVCAGVQQQAWGGGTSRRSSRRPCLPRARARAGGGAGRSSVPRETHTPLPASLPSLFFFYPCSIQVLEDLFKQVTSNPSDLEQAKDLTLSQVGAAAAAGSRTPTPLQPLVPVADTLGPLSCIAGGPAGERVSWRCSCEAVLSGLPSSPPRARADI